MNYTGAMSNLENNVITSLWNLFNNKRIFTNLLTRYGYDTKTRCNDIYTAEITNETITVCLAMVTELESKIVYERNTYNNILPSLTKYILNNKKIHEEGNKIITDVFIDDDYLSIIGNILPNTYLIKVNNIEWSTDIDVDTKDVKSLGGICVSLYLRTTIEVTFTDISIYKPGYKGAEKSKLNFLYKNLMIVQIVTMANDYGIKNTNDLSIDELYEKIMHYLDWGN